MSNTKETGNYGEIQASNYLVKKGYTIIARNSLMASMER